MRGEKPPPISNKLLFQVQTKAERRDIAGPGRIRICKNLRKYSQGTTKPFHSTGRKKKKAGWGNKFSVSQMVGVSPKLKCLGEKIPDQICKWDKIVCDKNQERRVLPCLDDPIVPLPLTSRLSFQTIVVS